ncbi:MAG: hypothetical protein AAF541_12415 [Pseudomonadota bacterium]
MQTGSNRFSQDQREQLVRDGYVVLPNAVPAEVIARARSRIINSMPKDERRLLVPPDLATHEDVLETFEKSQAAQILRHEMGPFPDVISCQVAVTPGYDQLGGEPGPHVDGSWSGEIPSDAQDINPDTGRPYDAARYFGEQDDIRGANDGQLWIDPERRISVGSYTALVGIALNDQLVPGNGQFAVIKGMHEEVEAHFRRQRDSGGVIGPEGLNWPRIKTTARGGTFCNGLPDPIRHMAHERAEGIEATSEWPWPELTPVCLSAGDAVIALHSCPHTPTPNLGPTPRMNLYFRIRRLREGNPHEGSRRVGHGVSDHPDRGYFGQFLEYPDEYNPWQTSIEKLCDHWSEWDGLQETVARLRAR